MYLLRDLHNESHTKLYSCHTQYMPNSSFVHACYPGQAHVDEVGKYMFGPIAIHSSHAVATCAHMRLHFCTYCGSFAHVCKSKRTRGLGRQCPSQPSVFGRRALRDIERGLDPASFVQAQARTLNRCKQQHSNDKRMPFHAQRIINLTAARGVSGSVSDVVSVASSSHGDNTHAHLEPPPEWTFTA